MLKIEDALITHGKCVFPVKGTSMLPLLEQSRDTVVVVPIKERAKKYDVVLYKVGDNYILHRVVKVKKDHYVIWGDNCILKELIPFHDVIGVAIGFNINGKYVSAEDKSYLEYAKKQSRKRWKRVLVRKTVYGAKRLLSKGKRLFKK